MLGILVSWLIYSVALWFSAAIVPGVQIKGFGGAVVVAAIFGVLNLVLFWVLFVAFGIVTLGLGFWLLKFLVVWVINAILLKLTDAITEKLTIRGFGSALLCALAMSLFVNVGTWLLQLLGLRPGV